jgi:hypothetical protein
VRQAEQELADAQRSFERTRDTAQSAVAVEARDRRAERAATAEVEGRLERARYLRDRAKRTFDHWQAAVESIKTELAVLERK